MAPGEMIKYHTEPWQIAFYIREKNSKIISVLFYEILKNLKIQFEVQNLIKPIQLVQNGFKDKGYFHLPQTDLNRV